jgi:PAS domain S-box-containing protein
MVSSTESGRSDGLGELVLMRELILNLPSGVAYVTGRDLVFEFANDEYRRIVAGRELVGLPLREALPGLSGDRLEVLERAIRDGRPFHSHDSGVPAHWDGKESEQIFIDFVCQPVWHDTGQVAGLLLFANDVSAHVRDRRRLEVLAERLAVTEERYRTLFETLPIGVVHYNADGTILGINPAAGQILGVDVQTLTSWPLQRDGRTIYPDGSPCPPDEYPVAVALRTGRIVADSVIGVPHGQAGEFRWLRVTAVPDARDERGRPQRAYAMVTDVTDQRRAEAASRESSRLLGRLWEVNVLGVVVSTDGGAQEANDAYLDIIGLTREDLAAGRANWRSVTPPEWVARDHDAVERLRHFGVLPPYEKEYTHRDGHRVPVLIGSAVIDWNPMRWVTYVVDLSARQRREKERAEAERRALESELQQAERLQTVGQLTSGIAHDFGNLLGVIVGYAELAEDVSVQSDPELRRILGEIRGAADRAVNLTGELLSFSQRRQAKSEPIDLSALIEDLTDLLSVSVSGSAKVVFEPWPGTLPLVTADRGQLEQVLLNLAVNARDAMPDGGTLTISTRPVEFGPEPGDLPSGINAGRHVELTVSDTGIGMSTEIQARIFERFFTTKSPSEGTGLGLSTVHGIIASLGGTIEVSSQEYRGTTFRVLVPAGPDPDTGT